MKRHADHERGASLVEFALILPVFFALILGMFTGGIAYNRKISLANAAREGSRYGATLPVGNFTGTDGSIPGTTPLEEWLSTVATTAQDNASGDLNTGTPGRQICIAYVYPGGTDNSNDVTNKLVRTDGGDTFTAGHTIPPCFSDGRTDGERRVQVKLTRTSKLEVLLFTTNLTLTGQSVTRFEAVP